jgi:hypothetical protein
LTKRCPSEKGQQKRGFEMEEERQVVYALWYDDEITPDNSGIMTDHVYKSEYAAMRALEEYAKTDMEWAKVIYQSPKKYTFQTYGDTTVDVYVLPLNIKV